MIHGTVVGLQARPSITLRLPNQSEIEVECVVDTGFEGALTLPPAMIAERDLPYLTQLSANLADDSNILTDLYIATLVWNGVERDVAVLAMGRRPLIGTALLEDSHLSVDFYEGGTVLIDEIL